MESPVQRRSVLSILKPASAGKEFVLTGAPIVIGRKRPVDIWLPSNMVSRRHAQVQMTANGDWLLQDLKSRNGTFLNGRRVSQEMLKDGDTIDVGHCELLFNISASTDDADVPHMEFLSGATKSLEELIVWEFVTQYALLVRKLNGCEREHVLLEALARGSHELCGAEKTAVGLFTDEGNIWRCRVPEGPMPELPRIPPALFSHISTQSMTFENLGDLGDVGDLSVYDPAIPSRKLLFPLRAAGNTYGVLFMELKADEEPMRKEHAALIRLLAMEAGNRIGFLRTDERHTLELNAARQIQEGLFPQTLELDPRLQAGAINLPSIFVSGDYYDLLRIDKNHVLFVVADAMGNGMSAAILMANFQAGFRVAGRAHKNIKRIHEMLTELTEANSGGRGFVTGILGLADLSTGIIELTGAGHPAPLLIHGDQVEALPDDFEMPPWGWPWEEEARSSTVTLHPGSDMLILYTDGVTDAKNETGQRLTIQGFEVAVRKACFQAPEDAIESLSDHVRNWSKQSLTDDVTLMALRWVVPAASGRRQAADAGSVVSVRSPGKTFLERETS